jgi:hypothetical protein
LTVLPEEGVKKIVVSHCELSDDSLPLAKDTLVLQKEVFRVENIHDRLLEMSLDLLRVFRKISKHLSKHFRFNCVLPLWLLELDQCTNTVDKCIDNECE